MKNSILTLLFCFFAQFSFSQTDSVTLKKNTIGVEVTFFLGQFLGTINDGYGYVTNGPYLLTYERNFGTLFFRSGFGMLYYSNNHTGHIQYSSNSDRSEYYVDYRFGLGQQRSIGNKWSWAYGFDFTGHNYLSEYNSGDGEEYESTETDKTFTYGGGPFLKISYSIFKNLSLGTESSLYYTQGWTVSREDYVNLPEENYYGSTFNKQVDLNYPISVWLSLNF